MRYPPDQKAKAQAAILHAGAQALRKHGFNGIGVDGLAAAAGVTSGAFYSNFANKEALLEEVIETCLGEPFVDPHTGTMEERQAQLRAFLAMYISDYHRQNPDQGCVMPTLSADVSRASLSVRQTYGERMKVLADKMRNLVGGDAADSERRAWSVISLMVGAVSISQAMPDGMDAESVIRAALTTAYTFIR
jgi:AcrR family transcriptional regulator